MHGEFEGRVSQFSETNQLSHRTAADGLDQLGIDFDECVVTVSGVEIQLHNRTPCTVGGHYIDGHYRWVTVPRGQM